MAMVSDEQRREVARRLRDRLKTDGIGGFTSGEFGNAVYFSVMHGRCGGYGEAGAFLADLIEPSGHECVPGECPINVRHDNDRIDRDALLALADEMDAHWLGHEGMEDSPVARWSRELREALGEAE